MVALSIDCLIFVEQESPLNLAFEMLFGPYSGINAVKSNSENLQGLIDEVCNLKSQVVVLEDLSVKTGEFSLANMLASSPELKIIVVLRESNYIYTFKKEEIMIESSSDFLEAIRSVSQIEGG